LHTRLHVYCQVTVKEYLHEIEELRTSRDEAANASKDNDKRVKLLEAELIHAQEELALAEKAKRNAQAERDEASDELSQANTAK